MSSPEERPVPEGDAEDMRLVLDSLVDEWDELDLPPLAPRAARQIRDLQRRSSA